MATPRPIRKTGSPGRAPGARFAVLLILLALAQAWPALAADAEFTAQVDREEVGLDDSVSLKLSIKADGGLSASQPQFQAPDFEVLNEYNSTYVESYYENGRFGMRNNQTLTKVLKPTKQGTLRISGISITVNGKALRAPDISVRVIAAGGGTPPPRGYGGGGVGLRGAGKRAGGKQVMVRAELDKQQAYKGEQIIVSYYLYRRVRVFNITVDKYPILSGFLREDLEMPVLGPRLDSEPVVVDGVPWERSLLLRYAAYPLQEGKLKIDDVALKYNYFAQPAGVDEDDPILNFFQQMVTRTGAEKSEQLTVDVVPLPDAGKPASFSGGVGDFNVTSAVDKYDVRANDAVTLTVKVEGKGNVASIGEPKAKWPDNVELYDSKGKSKSGKGGVGEKDFEFLLIPRQQGKLVLPGLEFSFFDPVKKTYVTRVTEPIPINVTEAAPGSQAPLPKTQGQGATSGTSSGAQGAAAPAQDDVLDLKTPDDVGRLVEGWLPAAMRYFYILCVIAFALLGLAAANEAVKRGRGAAAGLRASREKAASKSWDRLRAGAKAAASGAPWTEVTQTYELLTGAVFDALDRSFDVGARSLPRTELKRILVSERGLAEPAWERIGKLLEFGELVRFAATAGAVSERAARGELSRWVSEGESLVKLLDRKGERTGGGRL